MTNKKDKVPNQLNFNFLTNNVRGMLCTKKRVKMLEYLKSKIGPKGILFLQETHSLLTQKNNGRKSLKGNYTSRTEKPILAVSLLLFLVTQMS